MSLEQLLRCQFGVAATDQLRAVGLSRHGVAEAISRGVVSRSGRWLVFDPRWQPDGPSSQWKHEIFAAICSCSPQLRPQVVTYRRTAAALWRLDGVPSGTVELAVAGAHRGSGAVRRARPFHEGDICEVEGVRATSVCRTLIDLGQVVAPDVVERALETALRRHWVSLEALAREVRAARLVRGTAPLRELLLHRPAGLAPTESDAETLFVQLARRAGLPEPRRQFSVRTDEGLFRVDFAWPARRLAVEVDGAATHATREALARDLRRQNRLLLSLSPKGWVLMRFAWEDVALPPYVAQSEARLREAWSLGEGQWP